MFPNHPWTKLETPGERPKRRTGRDFMGERDGMPKGWWVLGAILLLGGTAWGWIKWRSPARTTARPLVALVSPPEIEGPEAGWLGRALWDSVDQTLMGDSKLQLIHIPQVEMALQEPDAPGRARPEFLATRFGAQRVISLLGSTQGNNLLVRVRIWDSHERTLHSVGMVKGDLSSPDLFLQALLAKLREALELPIGVGPPPNRLPHHLEAWKAYGRALGGLEAGDPKLVGASLADLRICLNLEPTFVPARIRWAIGLGEQFVQAGWFLPGESRRNELKAFEEAIFKAQTLDPTHPQVRLLAARQDFLNQNFQAAITQAEALLREDPNLLDADIILADSHLALPGPEARDQAKKRLERVIAMGDSRYYPNFRLAAVNLQEGNLDRALELGDRLIQGWPDRPMSYVMPSNALLWLNRHEEARQRLEAGLKRFPEAKLLHRNRAYAAFEAKDGPALERELAFAEGAWTPDQSTAILVRGLRPALNGDLAATQAIYASFLEQLRNQPVAASGDTLAASVDLYFMARTLAALGDPAKGRPYLEAAGRIFPSWSRPTRMDPAFR